MKNLNSHNFRTIAISPTSRGFGFAVMENGHSLIDWGVKSVSRPGQSRLVEKISTLIDHYSPTAMVLTDHTVGSRRSNQVQTLHEDIVAQVEKAKLRVFFLDPKHVRKHFTSEGIQTKHDIAERLANQFPVELGDRLPPKRKAWMSEDARMCIFDAVALLRAHGIANNTGN